MLFDGRGEGFLLPLLLPKLNSLKEKAAMNNRTHATQTMATSNGALELALHKIASVDVPQGKHIALAYSGGLDSTLCVKLSQLKYHARKLTAITVDVGQGEAEIQQSAERAAKLGIEPIVIDAKQEFTEQWLSKAIQANSDYNGYPVSTSMTRQLIAARVAQKAQELGCDALMEGSTGKGNDQYRMHNVFSLFAPGTPIFVPVRDFDLTRGEEQLNITGGANGIGKIDIFEDGIMGLKSREIYEAPAASILLKVHRDLEQFCLTKEEIQLKRQLDAQWARLVYHGEWFHPLKEAIDAFIASTQKVVNGEYTVELFKGNIDIRSRASASGLFFPDIRSIKSASFNQKECAPAAHLRGLPFELIARRNKMVKASFEGEQS